MECKSDNSEIEEDEEKELIDTLWNVNIRYTVDMSRETRINRYIMECK